jgi:predicted PurR-regulated permease PerM
LSDSSGSSQHEINTSSLARAAYILIIVTIALTLIRVGQTFLIPLVLAFMTWTLLNALSDHIVKIRLGSIRLPRWIATMLSITTLGLFLLGIYQLLASQADGLATAGPVYQENFSRLLNDLMTWVGMEQLPSTDSLFQNINIGSALGVLFPALLTLVQFDTLTPFLLITLGLGVVQFIIGNVIEPAFMGKSLNLSSFMIVLSLTFWGLIWGIPGMFLSVPIMVVIAIICARFKGLRGIAVVLSADGSLLPPSKHN